MSPRGMQVKPRGHGSYGSPVYWRLGPGGDAGGRPAHRGRSLQVDDVFLRRLLPAHLVVLSFFVLLLRSLVFLLFFFSFNRLPGFSNHEIPEKERIK